MTKLVASLVDLGKQALVAVIIMLESFEETNELLDLECHQVAQSEKWLVVRVHILAVSQTGIILGHPAIQFET